MNETKIICTKKPKLKNPILVVGLPGIGNVGRMAVGYMVNQLKTEKFAELYSPYFFHFVMIHDDMIHTLRNEFYYYKGKRDIIFMIGDCQTYDPKGHYEIAGKVMEFVKEMGCKEIITIGGFGTGKVAKKPIVLGTGVEPDYIKKYKKYGIDFRVGSRIGMIFGASGLMIGLGKLYNIKGLCLLGETSGLPIFTDPNAAEAVLNVLQKILGIKINLNKLHEKVEEMHAFTKKLEQLQQEALQQMKPKIKKSEDLGYIG